MIRPVTVAEIEDNSAMLLEYAAESAMPEIGAPDPQFTTYKDLEAAGVIHPLGAYVDDRLIGFILPVVAPPPHYGIHVATVESFFVRAPHRKGGYGLQLIDHAEELCTLLGAKAMLVVAPAGSQLERVMQRRRSYRHSNTVFVKALA